MNNSRQIGVAVIIAIIIGIVFYVAGFWHAANQAARDERQLTSQVSALQANLKATENRDHILFARVALFKAAGDMDQRNFGIANGHLKEASTALAAVDAGVAGIDAAQLGILRGQLDNFNVNVAQDLEAQRTQVLELGTQLDMLIPGSTPVPTPMPAPLPAPLPAPAAAGAESAPAPTPAPAPAPEPASQ